MPRCERCRKKTPVEFVCRYCHVGFCTSCYAPEAHQCAKMDEKIREDRARLTAQLRAESTGDTRVVRF